MTNFETMIAAALIADHIAYTASTGNDAINYAASKLASLRAGSLVPPRIIPGVDEHQSRYAREIWNRLDDTETPE